MNDHIIWCPTRRRTVLGDRGTTRRDALIRETAPLLACENLARAIVPDHLHVVVSAPPQWVPNQISARLTGTSSRIVRDEVPIVQRMPSRWTRSYVISTARNVSSDTIRRSIDAQSTRD